MISHLRQFVEDRPAFQHSALHIFRVSDVHDPDPPSHRSRDLHHDSHTVCPSPRHLDFANLNSEPHFPGAQGTHPSVTPTVSPSPSPSIRPPLHCAEPSPSHLHPRSDRQATFAPPRRTWRLGMSWKNPASRLFFPELDRRLGVFRTPIRSPLWTIPLRNPLAAPQSI